MAGDWIPIEIDLPEKPEVLAMAETLDIDPDAVAGKLIRVWGWFDRHTRDGHARGVTFRAIDGKAGVTGFAEAMHKEGWLLRTERGIQLPKFDLHHGKSAKTRLLGRARKQAQRARTEGEESPADGHDDVTPKSRNDRDTSVTTGQNRTSKSKSKKLSRTANAAQEDEPPGFAQFYDAYPLRKKRKDAAKAWLKGGHVDRLTMILADIAERTDPETGDRSWLDGFAPHPTTYLNGERWSDDIEPKRGPKRRPSALTLALADLQQLAQGATQPRLTHD